MRKQGIAIFLLVAVFCAVDCVAATPSQLQKKQQSNSTNTIRSGQTIKGIIGAKGIFSNQTQPLMAVASFPLELKSEPAVGFGGMNLGPSGAAPDTRCAGTDQNPTPQPGIVCIYPVIVVQQDGNLRAYPIYKYGVVVEFEQGQNDAGFLPGDFIGVWAYTAP